MSAARASGGYTAGTISIGTGRTRAGEPLSPFGTALGRVVGVTTGGSWTAPSTPGGSPPTTVVGGESGGGAVVGPNPEFVVGSMSVDVMPAGLATTPRSSRS